MIQKKAHLNGKPLYYFETISSTPTEFIRQDNDEDDVL
jgi:hypothetical protein